MIEIKQIQCKILEDVQILKKKDKSETTVELPKEHKDAIDDVHATVKALHGQVLYIGSVKPSVIVDIQVVDILNNNERMETKECDANTDSRQQWSSPISDNNNLDLTVGKTDIILVDSNLSGLQSDMLASNSTCIRVFGGAEVHDMISQ